ncbi:MAG: phosphatidylserine decarboxylase family protein [Acidobacteria bacterium]|nr:MAG: phosphatidylserine decarboxylase family protein [Acidobacteriota bacterium]
MAREGFPFVIVPLLIAFIFGLLQIWWIAILFIAIALFMAFFFRDPDRKIPEDADIIVSACDGKVTRIEENENGKLISVFLSPLDVHINRAPIAGRVKKVIYKPGRKMPATSEQASHLNERNSLIIENERITVICTQIAGILARRIVCWKKPGDNLEKGERFGLIKFGSRTDVLMPSSVEITVKVGDRVKGGETIIARLKNY